jgi:hypothetical protein
MMMLGGMIGEITEEAAVTAVLNSRSYPSFSIAGMNIEPNAAVSAIADPEIPPNMMDVTILTWASPPLSFPKKILVKFTILLVSPMLFMISPASRKRGKARKTYEFIPEKNRWETIFINMGLSSCRIEKIAVSPSTKPMGTPMIISPKKHTRINMAIRLPLGF